MGSMMQDMLRAKHMTLNDEDRRQWIMNDEGLYNWWKSSGIGLYRFVREHRAEITDAIVGRNNRERRA